MAREAKELHAHVAAVASPAARYAAGRRRGRVLKGAGSGVEEAVAAARGVDRKMLEGWWVVGGMVGKRLGNAPACCAACRQRAQSVSRMAI